MRHASIVYIGLLSLSMISCNNRNHAISEDSSIHYTTIGIDISPEFYDSVVEKMDKPRFVVISEDDKTMFAEICRIIDKNGKYFILDKYDGRTVVSFTHDGKPYASYGRTGNGPGEYVYPQDMDIKDSTVYILDSNSKKLIIYSERGNFIREQSLPFFADALKITDNGNYLFNLTPENEYQICVADSSLNNLQYRLKYDTKYKGGWSTNDIIRSCSDKTIYYRAPLDTLYLLDKNGVPTTGIVFDFLGKGLPEIAKEDYIEARRNGVTDNKLRMVNSPMKLSNDLWLGFSEDGENQYTILFDPENNRCGGRKFDKSSSVYDMIEPLGTDHNGNPITLLNITIAERCQHYEDLTLEIKDALEKAKPVLLIHNISGQ